MKERHLFTTVQWITFLVGLGASALSISAYAHREFETKENASRSRGVLNDRITEVKADLKEQLKDMNAKLDILIQRGDRK